MTRAILIDGFWAGEISQRDFHRLGLEAGMTEQQITTVIDEVKLEDGTFYEVLDSVRMEMAR